MNNDVSGKTPGGITKTPIVICPPAGAARLTAEGRSLALLIRHGQTDWNLERRLQGRECVPLNDVGRGQSTECGKLIAKAIAAGLDLKMMFSSPLGRAADTARFMANELPIDRIETCDELIERDYGALSGLNTEERRQLYLSGAPNPNLEAVHDCAERMKRAIFEMSKTAGGANFIAVTHGGVINALFSCLTAGSIGTGKNFSENCGVSIVASGRDATFPLAYGLVGDIFLNYIKEYVSRYKKLTERKNKNKI